MKRNLYVSERKYRWMKRAIIVLSIVAALAVTGLAIDLFGVAGTLFLWLGLSV